MNDQYLFENFIDGCDQLIENLNNECIKLNQELQEIYVPSEFPETNSSLILMDQNSSSGTFDPIAVSNGLSEDIPIDSERILNENEIMNMLMDNFIENVTIDNTCKGIDSDVLNHYLLSLQDNSQVNTNEYTMDDSMKSFLKEIKSHPVSLLEATFEPEKDVNLVSRSLIPTDQMEEIFPLKNNLYPNTINNIVSKT